MKARIDYVSARHVPRTAHRGRIIRRIMRNPQDPLLQLARIVHSMDKDLSEMRVSLAALKTTVAIQLNPADPSVGRAHIESVEKVVREAGFARENLNAVGDLIDAIRLIREHGSHET